jgi:hypothetical protein
LAPLDSRSLNLVLDHAAVEDAEWEIFSPPKLLNRKMYKAIRTRAKGRARLETRVARETMFAGQ